MLIAAHSPRRLAISFAFALSLAACGQGLEPEDSLETVQEDPDEVASAQQRATASGPVIGNQSPLWRRSAGYVGPCINGTQLDKGFVSINPTSYIVATYYKKSWTQPGGYYTFNRYIQASYDSAHVYWRCENSSYWAYGYPGRSVHRHQDYVSTCYGAACQYLFTSYSGWYANHYCDH